MSQQYQSPCRLTRSNFWLLQYTIDLYKVRRQNTVRHCRPSAARWGKGGCSSRPTLLQVVPPRGSAPFAAPAHPAETSTRPRGFPTDKSRKMLVLPAFPARSMSMKLGESSGAQIQYILHLEASGAIVNENLLSQRRNDEGTQTNIRDKASDWNRTQPGYRGGWVGYHIYIYICICICICICIIYIYIYVCIYMFACVCVYVNE